MTDMMDPGPINDPANSQLKNCGDWIRVDDPHNHSKGFHRMRKYNDSIARIAAINRARSDRWHPKEKGGIHSWSLADWSVALAGEVGELCNVVKKMNRERDAIVGNTVDTENLLRQLAAEVADVYLYLDLVAQRAGFDLNECIRAKFNATSERLGFPERL